MLRTARESPPIQVGVLQRERTVRGKHRLWKYYERIASGIAYFLVEFLSEARVIMKIVLSVTS